MPDMGHFSCSQWCGHPIKVMTGLMLHCGAQQVDYDLVKDTPTPDATETWTPVPHHHLVGLVREQLSASDMVIREESHALTADKSRYFGLFSISRGEDSDQYGTILGVRNAHDKRFPAALAAGANVFVCDNLSFNGEVKLGRRHTRHILRDLPQLVARTFGQLSSNWNNQQKRFDAYKAKDFSRMEANDFIIQAFERGACTGRHISKVLEQWKTPNHPEFKPRNGWSLFNAFTEVLKGNLNELPKRTEALHSFMDAKCDLQLGEQQTLAMKEAVAG